MNSIILPTTASMVLVLGATGAGKSYFIKKLAPENSKVIVSDDLISCNPFVIPILQSVLNKPLLRH